MNKQQAKRTARSEGAAYERCLCREAVDQLRACLRVSPDVRQHLKNSRLEFLKAIRAIINERIEHLSATGQQGTKVTVE